MEILVKDGLKWIENYESLQIELQSKQQELLTFDDVENYGYHIDDYFFYNFQNIYPDILSLERQKNGLMLV